MKEDSGHLEAALEWYIHWGEPDATELLALLTKETNACAIDDV